jgi:beta-glucanase (GH16 family)
MILSITGWTRLSGARQALSLLGYRCCNDRWGLLSANLEQLLDENLPLLFDAYIRVRSVSKAFIHVLELYPDAVFILPPEAQEGSDLSPEEYWAVRTRFLGEDDKLLTFDVCDPSGWRNLCKFLCCEIPNHPFPTNGVTKHISALLSGSDQRTPVVYRKSSVQEHDVHPWIVPYERMSAFGVLPKTRTCGTQVGMFKSIAADDFSSFDESRWTALEDSFPSNRAMFRRENIAFLPPHGCRMKLDASNVGDREYAAASLISKQLYHYGRFEVIMKPARAPGVVTAFFLHRNDPWQEIDMEILGRDTTKVLVNVYFNPGDPGTKCNFGNRGTPVMIDLTFDAAEDYHRYAIEWEPHEVRWFVDDNLIHVRGLWEPTPVPNLPMGLYCSIWPPNSGELAGELRASDLPVSSDVRRIELWEWCAALHVSPSQDTREPSQRHSMVDPRA